ncbi:MAG: glycosyltransferase family 4 protein [Bacillota bacterium]
MARVLHVIRPAEGGMKQHLLDLAGGLPQHGFTVAVAGPGDDCGGMKKDIEALGITYYQVDITGPLSPWQDLKCVYELNRLIKREKFDIVHCHGSKAGLVGRVAAWLAGTQVVIATVHNFVVYDEVSFLKRTVFTRGEKFLGRRTSGIITVSRALKEELADKFGVPGRKITAIYNGVDFTRFNKEPDLTGLREALEIREGGAVVGTVARMAPQKGLSYFIEAIAILIREGSAGNFIIVGDGPLRPGLEDLARRLGISGRVIFPGFQPDILPFLKLFDVFVVPSVAEGLSITTIEAMAAGKAVIASNVGGLPELVKPGLNGLLVPPRDAGALAQAIKTLTGQPELYKKMGLAGQNMVTSEFSIDTMMSKTVDFYRSCLAGNRVKGE